MQKITPFLWFDKNAEEALNFYTSIFKNSKIGPISRYNEEMAKAAGMKAGDVLVAAFELEGQPFTALNGGPMFKFTEAVSFSVECKDQEEVDYFWEKLTSGGGQESMCGWLKDKFGLSWQIVPKEMGELIGGKDAVKAGRAMHAMLQMKKLDIQKLRDAYNGK